MWQQLGFAFVLFIAALSSVPKDVLEAAQIDGAGPVRTFFAVKLPMISPNDVWWPHWLREAGVEVDENEVRPGVRLDVQAHEGHAAMAGQGVAMLTPFLWRNDIAEGRLVRLSDRISTRGYGYWLVYPEERRAVPKIKRFREWLLQEINREKADGPRTIAPD